MEAARNRGVTDKNSVAKSEAVTALRPLRTSRHTPRIYEQIYPILRSRFCLFGLQQNLTARVMEQIEIAHLPDELAVYAAYFTNVENTSFLRQQLLASNADFEYAFIDASLIVSRKQVLAALWRATNDYRNDRLKSRNIHSETVFSLSPNNNIGEAFRRFGIGESTRNLIVIKIATDPSITSDKVSTHLQATIKGKQEPLTNQNLSAGADMTRIRKIYKLGPAPPSPKSTNGMATPREHGLEDLEAQILGQIALRGVA